MAQDPRHLDTIERVVSNHTRAINDRASTILSRLSAHTHQYPLAVSSTGSVTNPYAGQIIYDTTDDLLYKYVGGVWVAFAATGTTLHETRYEQTTLQTVANATDTKLQFNTSVTTSSDVTVSGTGNTDYLLNRAGLWSITASTRYVAGTTGERHIFLSTGTVIGTLGNRIAGMSSGSPGTVAISLAVSTNIRVAASTSIFAGTFQSNGGNLNTDVAFGHSSHIALAWLRP